MPHDPRNPEVIFTAAQGIGCETVPGLFHFPVVQTGFFQGGYPYLVDRIVADGFFFWYFGVWLGQIRRLPARWAYSSQRGGPEFV